MFSEKLLDLSKKAEQLIAPQFEKIEQTEFENQQKIQAAFEECRISASHFIATDGYGYDDEGRDALNKVFAHAFGAESALVRPNFISGTHTLSTMLFGVLRPGDTLLSAAGAPYDTLQGVIRGNKSSLDTFNINYKEVALKDGAPDYDGIANALTPDVKAVLIQRSRGYALRPSLTIEKIEDLCRHIRSVKSDVIILVDNCYGEFVDTREPVSAGADLMAGSLIKNPGGGLAPTGGYIAGCADLVELCADALLAPGIGLECGSNYGMLKQIFQGFYLSPHTVAQAIKASLFAGAIFSLSGFDIYPSLTDKRSDIIQAIKLQNAENVKKFCRGIQSGSPVDSFVSPVPWPMPGYDCDIIMAAGTFTQGASIEISADAPMREPFAVYMQGGLTYSSAKIAILKAAEAVLE